MKTQTTKGIVLNRINYGEADRILTIITPDYGKIRAIAKGVRKEKSKLAGGIELFTITNLSYIPGRRDISTLVSTRLATNFGNIVKDLSRTQFGYTVLKTIDKITEDECEEEYFVLAGETLSALNDTGADILLTEAWFYLQLLRLMGHTPNLSTDTKDVKLLSGQTYRFDYDAMAFYAHPEGEYHDRHIKLLRLLGNNGLGKIANIKGVSSQVPPCLTLLKPIVRTWAV